MQRKLIVLAVAMACAGCAGQGAAPGIVKVAVATPCRVPVPAEPLFPASTLTGDEDLFTLVKTLWADRQARKAYELQLQAALAGCTAPEPGA